MVLDVEEQQVVMVSLLDAFFEAGLGVYGYFSEVHESHVVDVEEGHEGCKMAIFIYLSAGLSCMKKIKVLGIEELFLGIFLLLTR